MTTTDAFGRHGPNDWLIDEMRARWNADPSSVDHQWRVIFDNENGTQTASTPEAKPLIDTTASDITPTPATPPNPAPATPATPDTPDNSNATPQRRTPATPDTPQ
ncbi:MAG: hypothetical protein OXN44_12240, partial [Acidimicrobiaceae bacterium]|nr:hypothetical protein [Acidimicrobiaceae bacterium]